METGDVGREEVHFKRWVQSVLSLSLSFSSVCFSLGLLSLWPLHTQNRGTICFSEWFRFTHWPSEGTWTRMTEWVHTLFQKDIYREVATNTHTQTCTHTFVLQALPYPALKSLRWKLVRHIVSFLERWKECARGRHAKKYAEGAERWFIEMETFIYISECKHLWSCECQTVWLPFIP